MYRLALALLSLLLTLDAQPVSAPEGTQSVVSLNPTVTISGGSPAHHRTVDAAIDRFITAGLALPNLRIRIHPDKAGCDDKQGVFRPRAREAVIDLCFDREFLALHELGHAWVRFNLEDQAREKFLLLTEASSWAGPDTAWHRRGSEIAANALAHGLLSLPLESVHQRTRQLEQFRALTGRSSPRLAEIEPAHASAAPATT